LALGGLTSLRMSHISNSLGDKAPRMRYVLYLLVVCSAIEHVMQISTCTGLAAMDYANTRNSKGLHVTGVGASICARHGFLRPLGIGDLQKGERCVRLHSIGRSD
jgi:hypothetical protein